MSKMSLRGLRYSLPGLASGLGPHKVSPIVLPESLSCEAPSKLTCPHPFPPSALLLARKHASPPEVTSLHRVHAGPPRTQPPRAHALPPDTGHTCSPRTGVARCAFNASLVLTRDLPCGELRVQPEATTAWKAKDSLPLLRAPGCRPSPEMTGRETARARESRRKGEASPRDAVGVSFWWKERSLR